MTTANPHKQLFQAPAPESLQPAARYLLDQAGSHRIVAFYGSMGVGKTTFIHTICRMLGVRERMSSPTFALINEYKPPPGTIYHMDFYRIKSPEEIAGLGLDHYLDSQGYCFIEWPESAETWLPEARINVYLQLDKIPDGPKAPVRHITITHP